MHQCIHHIGRSSINHLITMTTANNNGIYLTPDDLATMLRNMRSNNKNPGKMCRSMIAARSNILGLQYMMTRDVVASMIGMPESIHDRTKFQEGVLTEVMSETGLYTTFFGGESYGYEREEETAIALWDVIHVQRNTKDLITVCSE